MLVRRTFSLVAYVLEGAVFHRKTLSGTREPGTSVRGDLRDRGG